MWSLHSTADLLFPSFDLCQNCYSQIMSLSKMSINLKRDMKFSDLNEGEKLMVTKWLPTKVKISLVDIFPPITSQISAICLEDLMDDKPISEWTDVQTEQAKNLLVMLDHVTKIRIKYSSYFPRRIIDIICSNPDIVYFDSVTDDFIIEYIEECIDRNPEYDGHRIENIFSTDEPVLPLLWEYEKLKLNLQYTGRDKNHHLIQDDRIRGLIKRAYFTDRDLLYLMANPVQFESLTDLELRNNISFIVQNIEKIRYLNPCIKKLVIQISSDDLTQDNAMRLVNCVLSIRNLQSLRVNFGGTWNEDQIAAYHTMVAMLLNADEACLTDLVITSNIQDKPNLMAIMLWNDIRRFKYVKIVNRRSRLSSAIFEVKNRTMSIQYFRASLFDVFVKFPHVTSIKTFMPFYHESVDKEAMATELEVIRSNLPRNQWVTLNMEWTTLPTTIL